MNPFDPEHRFRVTHEETKAVTTRGEWSELEIIPCGKGGPGAYVYKHGEGIFGFTGRGMSLRRSLLAAGAQAWQTGDEEFSVTFPDTLAAGILKVVRAKVKRAGRSADEMARIRLAQGPKTGLGTTIGTSAGPYES